MRTADIAALILAAAPDAHGSLTRSYPYTMEAVMRQNQERLGLSLPYPNNALQPAPTTKRLKEILQPIEVIQWQDEDGRLHRYRTALSLVQRQALLLLGMDSRRFTQVPSG